MGGHIVRGRHHGTNDCSHTFLQPAAAAAAARRPIPPCLAVNIDTVCRSSSQSEVCLAQYWFNTLLLLLLYWTFGTNEWNIDRRVHFVKENSRPKINEASDRNF